MTDDTLPGAREQSRPGLSARERAVLQLEARTHGGSAVKDAKIRGELGISPVRYYRELAELIDTERAIAFDPLLVARLRRRRDEARRRRGVLTRAAVR